MVTTNMSHGFHYYIRHMPPRRHAAYCFHEVLYTLVLLLHERQEVHIFEHTLCHALRHIRYVMLSAMLVLCEPILAREAYGYRHVMRAHAAMALRR